MWCVEYDIIEEGHIEAIESGGIDEGHEGVQVFAEPFEPKFCESRKDRACRGRRASRVVTITSGEKYPEWGIFDR